MKWKNFSYLIVILLIVFLLFWRTYSPISGMAVGSLNVTISTISSINFTVNFVDFGPGSVYLNSSSATIDTRGNVTGGNWTPIDEGFVIENIGNTNLSVFLSSQKNATEFLGGTNPQYEYLFNNLEQNSCTQTLSSFNTWISLNNTGYGDRICENLQRLDTNDSLRIDLRLVIPSDAIRGTRSDTILVTGISS